MSARTIVQQVGMSARPEFYSGRGANLSDLNSTILAAIADLILSRHGEAALRSFVQMVADLETLSATAFLQSLYRLEANDWHWNGTENTPSGLYATDAATGLATIAGVLGGMNAQDSTPAIRHAFLRMHGVTPLRRGNQKEIYEPWY